MTRSFLLMLLATAIYGVVHSFLAADTVKAAVERRTGRGAFRFYRLFYNLVASAAIAPLWLALTRFPDAPLYSIPFPQKVFFFALQAAAAAGLVASVAQTGVLSFLGIAQLSRPGAAKEEKTALVKTGLFRLVRHPAYSCGIAMLWLSPAMTVNLLALNAGLSAYMIVGAFIEERRLVVELGDEYRDYRRRTPMFVPGMNLLRGVR